MHFISNSPKQLLRRGFTLVELLIVIVVIGVLATVSVMAYNGVQQNAANAKLLTSLSQWESVVRQYVARNQSAPLTIGGDNVCLGENYAATADFPANSCWADTGGTSLASVSTTFTSTFKSAAGTLPTDSSDVVAKMRGKFNHNYRGISYVGTEYVAGLTVTLLGNVSCGSYTKFYYGPPQYTGPGVTKCTATINIKNVV